MSVIPIGLPILVRVSIESVEITIRIIIVPVVRTRISRGNTHAVMNSRATAAHQRAEKGKQQDSKKSAGFFEAEIHKQRRHITG